MNGECKKRPNIEACDETILPPKECRPSQQGLHARVCSWVREMFYIYRSMGPRENIDNRCG